MYNVLDLFCGAGGLSSGLKSAGLNILAGIDNDESSLKTFKKNHTNSIALLSDLGNIEPNLFKQIDRAINNKSIDVLVGGPPCQGLSIAGKRLENDPRNSLWRSFIDIIKHYEPNIILLENVPTIKSLFKGQIAKKIIESFNELGYFTDFQILLASDFGVPQNRKRAFFIACKKNQTFFSFPQPSQSFKKISCYEALSDLPLLDDCLGKEEIDYPVKPLSEYQKRIRNGSKKIYNHISVKHTQKTKKIISLVPDGGNYKDLPNELRGTRNVNIAWTRMNSKLPCFTIDAGHNHHFHYQANRVPTVRECARIQSFHDTFRFIGNRTSQYRQVGNAVPPLLGFEIGKEIIKALKNV